MNKEKLSKKKSKDKNVNVNKLLFKFRLKNFLLDLFNLAIIFMVAFLFDKLLESIVFVISYTIIRGDFTKAVHGSNFTDSENKSMRYCRLITFGIQLVSLFFIAKIDLSKYVNILLSVVLGVINFFAGDYLEYKFKKNVFYKGMKEIPSELNGIEYEIMYQYYIKRYRLDKIAMNLDYSVDSIKKIKAKIIKRYS